MYVVLVGLVILIVSSIVCSNRSDKYLRRATVRLSRGGVISGCTKVGVVVILYCFKSGAD